MSLFLRESSQEKQTNNSRPARQLVVLSFNWQPEEGCEQPSCTRKWNNARHSCMRTDKRLRKGSGQTIPDYRDLNSKKENSPSLFKGGDLSSRF